MKSEFFQDLMPDNRCFGCGHNHEGLKIKSYWKDELSVCEWTSKEKYHGWSNLMNGGIIATIIDCHCICTAMADAYKREHRSFNSDPKYIYATGSLEVKYLKPTPNTKVRLEARITKVKGRKTILKCELFADTNEKTVEASVVAIRAYDSSQNDSSNLFK